MGGRPPAAHRFENTLDFVCAKLLMVMYTMARALLSLFRDHLCSGRAHHGELKSPSIGTVAAEPEPISLDWAATALLIIDMQRDFMEPGGFGEPLAMTCRSWHAR